MNKPQITDAIRNFLDNDDWHYEYDAENSMVRMGLNLKSKLKNCRIFIDIKNDAYLVYLVSQINADKDNLSELMRYLTIANYGLINGNFELDIRDGEVRYKTYVNCDGLETLPEQVIKDSLYLAAFTLDRYGDGLAALIMGFSTADEEIQKIRAATEAEKK